MSKIFIDKKFNNTRTVQSLKVPIYETLPTPNAGEAGNVVFNSNDNTFYGCDGIVWTPFGGGISSFIPPGVTINVDGSISFTQFTTNVFNTTDGTLRITGSNGPPTGDPGTTGGELVWDITSGDLYIHVGGGVWQLVGGGFPVIPPGTIVNVDGSISFPQFTTNVFNTTDGTLQITGSNGPPTGNPGTTGGELVWDITSGDLYIHTGGGTWLKLGPQSLSETLAVGNTTDGLDINVVNSDIVLDNVSNIVTGQTVPSTNSDGFISITGVVANPTGVPSGSGQLAHNITTNQVFLHTGAGVWLPITGTIVPFVLNNVGGGVAVFDTASPAGVGNLRTFVSSDSSVSIVQVGNQIDLTVGTVPPPSITIQNIGAFGADLYDTASVPPTYDFRRLYSNNGSVSIIQEVDRINIEVTASSPVALSNVGGGSDVYVAGSASPFQLRTISSPLGTVTINQTGTEIQLEVAGATPLTFANIGSGLAVGNIWDGNLSPVGLRQLSSSDGSILIGTSPGGGINLQAIIASPSSVVNVGTGAPIYITGTAPFQLKTLVSGDGSIAIITSNPNEINLQATTSLLPPSINANLYIPSPSGRLQIMNVSDAGTPWEPPGVANQVNSNVIYIQSQDTTARNKYFRMEINDFTGTTLQTANNAPFGATYPGVSDVILPQNTDPLVNHFNDFTISSGNNLFIGSNNRGNVFINAGTNFFDTANAPGNVVIGGGSSNSTGTTIFAGSTTIESGLSPLANGASRIRCNGPRVTGTSPSITVQKGTIEFIQDAVTIIEINSLSTTDVKQGNVVLSNPASNLIVTGGSVLVFNGGNIRLVGPGGQLTTNDTANVFITSDGDIKFNPSRGIYMVYPTVTVTNLPRPNYLTNSSAIAPVSTLITLNSSAGEIEFDFSNQPFWGTGSLDFQLNNNKVTQDSQVIFTVINGSVSSNSTRYPIDVFTRNVQNGSLTFSLTNNAPNYNIPFLADNSSPWIVVGGNGLGNLPIWWSGTQFAFDRFNNAALTAPGRILNVVRTNSGAYIAVGNNKSILRSTAGIANWSVITTPVITGLQNQIFQGLDVDPYTGRIIIGTSRGAILSSTDDGLNWVIINPELTSPTVTQGHRIRIYSIKFDMLTRYWMIGGEIVYISGSSSPPKGFITWSLEPSMLSGANHIDVQNEIYTVTKDPFYRGWYAGGRFGIYVVFNTDIPSNAPSDFSTNYIFFQQNSGTQIISMCVDNSNGAILAAGGILQITGSTFVYAASIWRSTNNGQTWSLVEINNDNFFFFGIWKDPMNNRYFACGGTGADGAQAIGAGGGDNILFQSYDGINWTRINNRIDPLSLPDSSEPWTTIYKPPSRLVKNTARAFTGTLRVRFAIIEKRV
jgi:hypothetical protein